MPTFTKRIWPVADRSAVCAIQDIAGAGNLVLNGTLASPLKPNLISFLDHGFIRSISISSANDLTGVTFTVTGTQNGAFIQEAVTGPAANSIVHSNERFDIITSITTNGAAAGVHIGTGDSGYLPLIKQNVLSDNGLLNYAMSVTLSTDAQINYSMWRTLDKIENNGISFKTLIGTDLKNPRLVFLSYFDQATGNQYSTDLVIFNYMFLSINNSGTPDTDNLTFIFLQA